jgi:hypothetical protein
MKKVKITIKKTKSQFTGAVYINQKFYQHLFIMQPLNRKSQSTGHNSFDPSNNRCDRLITDID